MTGPARALHPRDGLRPGAWYACDFPERPATKQTAFDFECPACCLALEAHQKITGQAATIEERTAGGVELPRKVSATEKLKATIQDRRR